MVEYALLLGSLASGTIQTLSSQVGLWASEINWHALTYALLALVALRIAFWAFRPSDH